MKQLTLTIHGRVQGVFFRTSARNKARELGLVGWVKNTPDGSVAVVAQGEEEALRALYEWCTVGPRHAAVEHMDETWEDIHAASFDSFDIL